LQLRGFLSPFGRFENSALSHANWAGICSENQTENRHVIGDYMAKVFKEVAFW